MVEVLQGVAAICSIVAALSGTAWTIYKFGLGKTVRGVAVLLSICFCLGFVVWNLWPWEPDPFDELAAMAKDVEEIHAVVKFDDPKMDLLIVFPSSLLTNDERESWIAQVPQGPKLQIESLYKVEFRAKNRKMDYVEVISNVAGGKNAISHHKIKKRWTVAETETWAKKMVERIKKAYPRPKL